MQAYLNSSLPKSVSGFVQVLVLPKGKTTLNFIIMYLILIEQGYTHLMLTE